MCTDDVIVVVVLCCVLHIINRSGLNHTHIGWLATSAVPYSLYCVPFFYLLQASALDSCSFLFVVFVLFLFCFCVHALVGALY